MAVPGPLLGVGKEAEVYVYGDKALKLYKAEAGKSSAFGEAAILALVERLGLPAPRPFGVLQHEGRWGIVMTRIEGGPVSAAALSEPGLLKAAVSDMAKLQQTVHACPGAGFPSLRSRLAAAMASAPGLGKEQRVRLAGQLAAMPRGDRLCHGDFHPLNVLGLGGAPVIVDWLDATEGSPAADICRSYVLLSPSRPELAEQMLQASLEVSGLSRAEVLGWLPIVAAARLSENVPHDEPWLLAAAAKS